MKRNRSKGENKIENENMFPTIPENSLILLVSVKPFFPFFLLLSWSLLFDVFNELTLTVSSNLDVSQDSDLSLLSQHILFDHPRLDKNKTLFFDDDY